MQQEFLIKFIKEGQIKVVMKLWVYVLSKMLWKFGNIEIVRWNDNSVVKIGINACGVQPIESAKRWIKGKGKQNIQQPAIITAYNQWS